LLADSGDGTDIDAGAAICTFGRVDLVFSVRSLGDSSGGAGAGTGTASDAFGRIDFMRHIFTVKFYFSSISFPNW